MPPHKIVFLNGPPGCGKDTVGRMLAERYGAQLFKAATPLRQAMSALIGCEDSEIEQLKSTPIRLWAWRSAPTGTTGRDLLIALSEDLIKPRLGMDWFGHMLGQSIATAAPRLAVVTDAGFVSEVEACCKNLPGWEINLWHVTRPGCDFSGDSRSWISLRGVRTRVVLNDGSLDQLQQRVVCAFDRGYVP
jgi:hypothetical protein